MYVKLIKEVPKDLSLISFSTQESGAHFIVCVPIRDWLEKMQITWIYSLQPLQCCQRVQVFALRGDCLSRVDFPLWFVVRKDIRTVKSTLSISKISPPKPHVRPLLIGIYCIDLLVSHLNTSIIIFIFSKLALDIW